MGHDLAAVRFVASTGRPGERRDPSVSAIALIAAGAESRFGSVAKAVFNKMRQGLWVPAFAGTDPR